MSLLSITVITAVCFITAFFISYFRMRMNKDNAETIDYISLVLFLLSGWGFVFIFFGLLSTFIEWIYMILR